jgi:hypothetical protein
VRVLTLQLTHRFRTVARLAALPVTVGLVTDDPTGGCWRLADVDAMWSLAASFAFTAQAVTAGSGRAPDFTVRPFTFDFTLVAHRLFAESFTLWRQANRLTDRRTKWLGAVP